LTLFWIYIIRRRPRLAVPPTNTPLNRLIVANAFPRSIDLTLPVNGSIDRAAPSWTTSLQDQYLATIDTFSKYDNVLAYGVGNEVIIDPSGSGDAAFIKASARDIRAYLSVSLDCISIVPIIDYDVATLLNRAHLSHTPLLTVIPGFTPLLTISLATRQVATVPRHLLIFTVSTTSMLFLFTKLCSCSYSSQ
jgi:hypothetical protein